MTIVGEGLKNLGLCSALRAFWAGIGYETAKCIAMRGARVIIACRSEERAKAAIERMQAEFKEEKTKGTPGICSREALALEFMALDLTSLKSVEKFIDDFKAKEYKIHVLLCNAGVALHAQEYTEDGFKIMFQIMQMYLLNRRLHKTNVTVNSIHPGMVETEITRSFTDTQTWKLLFQLAKLVHVSRSPFEGSMTSITAAVNPQFKDTRDAYFTDMKIGQASSLARDQQKQEALWRYSVDCLKDFIKTEDLQYLEDL